MDPRSILVTGADGFVGRHLMRRLAREFPASRLLGSTFDILDAAAVNATVQTVQPSVVIHLAAVSAISQANDDPAQAWAVNLGGTLTLARALLTHAASCQFLYVSSADAYGASFSAGRPLDETALLAPLNTYAATKAAADLAIGAMAQDGLRAVRLRPFNHTGPGQSAAFVISAFAEQIQRIRAGLQHPVLRVGNLEARRDFLDVRDVVAAYVACIIQADDIPAGRVLNISSGRSVRIGDVLRSMLDRAGVVALIDVEPDRMRKVDIGLACGNAKMIEDLLGWRPIIPWEQTISDVLEDWRGRL